ncbi:MAG TPA: alkaline phosphatase family protein, partial [Pirellulaceae bacterium]|nr:alkaline phosphatase family protein [Pirellulaceae bacterium]
MPRLLCAAILASAATLSTLHGGASLADAAEPADSPRNVIVVTFDGFRRQDFFTGAEAGLCDSKFGGAKEPQETQRKYLRETAEQRREILLPFLWGVVAKQGQIFGDPGNNAPCRLTNGLKFSYPGYNEMFTGKPDPRVISNNKINNPNLTVLEFLQGKPAFKGRVAAFCTWDVFPFIFRAETSGVHVQLGWNPLRDEPLTPGQKQVNELIEQLPRYWPGNSFDILTMQGAREHLIKNKPRVLYIGLGETDEWAHGRRYDLYLDAAHRSDRYIADLWQLLQTMPEYKDRTNLIITTDHGRGGDRETWVNHDKNTENGEYIWMAAFGPDVAPLGVRRDVETTQSQL